jgi:glycosyltransferase involved in cell wall biosynthesis
VEVGEEQLRLPRITLVTAVYNGEAYLEDTIRSIVYQGYPNLEYIIVNDGSTDRTVEIIRDYERFLTYWINQTNHGLYAALNAGFAKSSGEVLGWLNSSDMFHTHGLFVVGSVFASFREVQWVTGRPTLFHGPGWPSVTLDLPRWSRCRFLAGANRHVQQESTFWRRSLWEAAGGRLSMEYRAEGDFELWVRFFRHAKLYTVDAQIAGWRHHPDALSHGNIERYDRNYDEIIEKELADMSGVAWIKLFRRVNQFVKPIPVVRGILRRLVVKGLYKLPGPDWTPVIEYRGGRWRMRD